MTPPLRMIVADDEPLVRAMLVDILRAEPDVAVVADVANGIEAVAAIDAYAPDVAFLDVQMPGLTGIDVARAVAAHGGPLLVFVTAFDEYAVDAFDVNAVDYVLKPFDADRVRRTLARARERLHARRAAPTGPHAPVADARLDAVLLALEARTARPRWAERFVVGVGARLRVIDAADVEWIEADGNYARLHTPAGAALLRETMRALEARLDPHVFARVHRSAIVRLAAVHELKPLPSGDYTLSLRSGARVTMSRTYRDDVLRTLAE